MVKKRMRAVKLLFILILTIDVCVKPAQGCWSWGGGGGTPTTKKPKRTTPGDEVDRNLPHAWGGFELPENLKTKWKNWLTDYKTQRKKEADESDEKYKKDRGPGSGWPDSWQGMGGGHGGDKPPPWSYHPINTGLPEYCYQPPVRGECFYNAVIRWAYNPYLDECVEFEFVCAGNQNNFDTKERCVKMCMIEPVTGCDVETNIYIDT